MTPGVAVAASGGRDSTALLHATVRAARPLGLKVWAFHVHHGLSRHADAWAAHVRAQCRRWSTAAAPVGFDMVRLQGRPQAGESVEAWARRGRYQALADMAQRHGVGTLLLAHHQRDQAETVLLQGLRGGGPAGAAAMPAQALRSGLTWLRPWLERDASEVEAYVHRWHLRHIEDDSNADPRYARNRVRHQVWPALVEAFPHAGQALAASARRMAEASACLQELAEADLAACQAPEGGLSTEALRHLSRDRRCNLLRHWLGLVQTAPVPDTLVRRLAEEAVTRRGGLRWPAPQGEVRLEKGLLCHVGIPALDVTSPG
jgi:tRNA(Ile)-lysidine synthase